MKCRSTAVTAHSAFVRDFFLSTDGKTDVRVVHVKKNVEGREITDRVASLVSVQKYASLIRSSATIN